MKKFIIISVIIIVPLMIAGYFLLNKEKNGVNIEWETKTVERGDMEISITATGTLEAVKEVEVGTQVSGIISVIYVDFNSKVRKGQVIARLDTTTLASQVYDSKANYTRKRIMVDQAKRNMERAEDLYKEKVMAQVEYDKVLDDYETARSNLLSADAQLERAKINLSYATIISPIDGVIISRNVEQGQTVASSFNSPTLFHIVNDLTKMQVEASIDEADIGQIEEGQKVNFTVDAYPDDTFNGVVRQKRLKPEIVSNVVTYIVIVDVPNPDLKLMPGMTASITVLIDERRGVLKIPSRALSFQPPYSYLEYYQNNLPDSVKQAMDDRVSSMRKRMKERGMTDSQIDERLRAVSSRIISGGGSGGGMGGGQGFPGAGGDAATTGASGSAWSSQGQPGMVWVKEGDEVKPLRVRTGMSDGSFAELIGDQLKEGMEVVTAAIYDEDKEPKQDQARSPFVPQMGSGRGRGLR